MYRRIDKCRICGGEQLRQVLDLGDQVLTGVFPRSRDDAITRGPLRLVKCVGRDGCGLLQLEHSYDLAEMYGDNYGYRSGLNPSMVKHLTDKVNRIAGLVDTRSGDLVVDIGSNDGTTLRAYGDRGLKLVGVDPTGVKFRQYYPPTSELIPDFFSAAKIRARYGQQRAKVVTSIAMFYDLESPLDFMRQIHDILADDGIWVFEQAYMPSMLASNTFDTVCHEHLEFYALAQIKWMADRVGFTIVDLELNDINGGSFSVTVRKSREGDSQLPEVERVIQEEERAGLQRLEPFIQFQEHAQASRKELIEFVKGARQRGETVAGLGASTKGNVLLQYCGFKTDDLFAIGEVNSDKFGCVTPGSWIPIIPQAELLARKPDYIIVLPWHFRDFFVKSDVFCGQRLVFPLPKLSVYQH